MKSIYVCLYEMLNNVNRSMMCVNLLEVQIYFLILKSEYVYNLKCSSHILVKWHVWFTPVAFKPFSVTRVTITGDILKSVEFSHYPSLTLLQKSTSLLNTENQIF